MFDVGRVCVKIAGRDAGKKCVIVDVVDVNFVIVDGQTRRRKCNVKHLEPLDQVIKIAKAASHSVAASELKNIGIEVEERKQAREKKARPKKQKKKKQSPAEEMKKKPKKAKEEKKIESAQ
jgi:large subunit ribosomal protein L14e